MRRRWFIGGYFTAVGGIPRPGIAHVAADGSVSPWNRSPNGAVLTLTLHGSRLYAGGLFRAGPAKAR